MMAELQDLWIDDIVIGERKRKIDNVSSLAESVQERGLLQRIGVRKTEDGTLVLMFGERRLEACRFLKWETIPSEVFHSISELDAELAEIDENLEREEVTALERSSQLKRKKEIYEARHPETKPGAVGSKAATAKRLGVQTEDTDSLDTTPSFVEEAAKKLGVTPRTISDDVRIAELPDEIKGIVEGTPAENNREGLLEITRLRDEDQAEAAHRLSQGKTTAAQLEKERVSENKTRNKDRKPKSDQVSPETSAGRSVTQVDLAQCPIKIPISPDEDPNVLIAWIEGGWIPPCRTGRFSQVETRKDTDRLRTINLSSRASDAAVKVACHFDKDGIVEFLRALGPYLMPSTRELISRMYINNSWEEW